MFTWRHLLWLGICVCLIAVVLIAYGKKKPPLRKVLTSALVLSIMSEICKMISVIRLVPSTNGELLQPYITPNHLPLHLCSIQILLIALVRFTKNDSLRENILAFMYPTCIIGAIAALAMPSIFTTTIAVEDAFKAPIAYQFFLFHSMLIALGVIIARSGEIKWEKKHLRNTLLLIYLMGCVSIYLNSMFASPTYIDGELVSVDFWTNFFFTYQNPLGIRITELWQWYLYLGILIVLAAVLLFIFFAPLIYRGKKKTVAED